VTPESAFAAEEQARAAAARLRGATEALNVLGRRSPADQQRASLFAAGLLRDAITETDLRETGLPVPLPAVQQRQPGQQGQPGQQHQPGQQGASPPGQADGSRLPAGHPAVLLLARAAMVLHSAGLRICERPWHWDRLARFFDARLPASDPHRFRLHERALMSRVDAGDTSPAVIAALRNAVEFHRAAHGEDAYLTSIATTNLALAFRQRRGEGDQAASTALAEQAVRLRAASYGPEHPLTLEARSLVALCRLLQAEGSQEEARHGIAGRVLAEVTAIRAARMRLYGSTAPDTARSRKHEALALLLLGEPERAGQALELTLAMEAVFGGADRAAAVADTRLLLAAVSRALGDKDKALEHAREANRIYCQQNPRGHGARRARHLVERLTAGRVTAVAGAEMPRTRSEALS
jgi:tetratricopeptide (TPR) repeat protein